MKSILTVAAVAALTLGMAAQANAYMLGPVGSFTATGPTILALGSTQIPCTTTFTGKISKTGAGTVTGFQAVGAGPYGPVCASIQATLPWGAKAINANTISFQKVSVTVPGVVTCGPGSLKVTDNGSGLITYNTLLNPGGCSVSSTGVQSSPPVTIH